MVLRIIEVHLPTRKPSDDNIVVVANPESASRMLTVSRVPPMFEPELVNIEPTISQVLATPEWMVVLEDQLSAQECRKALEVSTMMGLRRTS